MGENGNASERVLAWVLARAVGSTFLSLDRKNFYYVFGILYFSCHSSFFCLGYLAQKGGAGSRLARAGTR